jgi:hypothetical protein
MSNNIAAVLPTILKYGALALREYAVMPRLVNSDYKNEVSQKGQIINVEIPSAKTAADVNPGTPAGVGDVAPTTFPIPLTNWKEAGFVLSDKELAEMDANQVLSGEASEALKALVNAVDLSILANYKSLFQYTGTSGSVPNTVDAIIDGRKALNGPLNLAPSSPRAHVVNGTVEANYLKLALFTSKADSDTDAQISGALGKRFNFDIVYDQNMENSAMSFTKGTGTGYVLNGAHTAGTKTITAKTGSNNINVGDIITIVTAAGTQPYVATSQLTAPGTFTVYPGLRGAGSDSGTITVITTTGQQNLFFHRDCFSFASRPLDTPQGLGVISATEVDPVSGISLRLEVSRPHKQTRWSWDILWGTACTRPELGARQIAS